MGSKADKGDALRNSPPIKVAVTVTRVESPQAWAALWWWLLQEDQPDQSNEQLPK